MSENKMWITVWIASNQRTHAFDFVIQNLKSVYIKSGPRERENWKFLKRQDAAKCNGIVEKCEGHLIQFQLNV